MKESFNEIEESVALTFIGEPKEVESISEGKIVYSSLSDEDKACYDEILDCILRHDEEVSLSVTDEDEVERIYHSVMADNGGLFWLDGYSYSTYTKDGNV